MPDKWEYPWFAAWDLAFHCVALAHLDPAFAKYQLLLLCREWFQHPSGALPAYEWDFGDVNPPMQAWAALEVFAIDGARDLDFLSRVFDKLLVNFTWWVNREDADGSNLFEGGFLGLDNIGPIDRSHLPVGGRLEQSDATGWMAFYALSMAAIASILNLRPASHARPGPQVPRAFRPDPPGHGHPGGLGRRRRLLLRQLVGPDGRAVPVKVRSMVGVIPLVAAVVIDEEAIGRAETVGKAFARLLREVGGPGSLAAQGLVRGEPGDRRVLSAWSGSSTSPSCSPSCSTRASSCRPAGPVRLPSRPPLRARGRRLPGQHRLRAGRVDHRDVRRELQLAWAHLVPAQCFRALERYHRRAHRRVPDGRPRRTLDQVAADLRRRLVDLFVVGRTVGDPASGVDRLQRDPPGAATWSSTSTSTATTGPGSAPAQTGWTGLVADLIRGRPSADGVYAIGDLGGVVDRARP